MAKKEQKSWAIKFKAEYAGTAYVTARTPEEAMKKYREMEWDDDVGDWHDDEPQGEPQENK